MPTLAINPPKALATPSHQTHPPPTNDFLTGTWHVTHTSLPLWKNKRNVKITYKPLPGANAKGDGSGTGTGSETGAITKLDDLVEYQKANSAKIHSVHGIDTPAAGDPGAWDWRGKGWLVIASSHWECLGFGRVEDGNEWVVTYFAKTLFTPAGIDVYSRSPEGLAGDVMEGIWGALGGLGVGEIDRLVSGVFEVPRD
ncbi:Calycin [Penicillium nucicola]|uniref:Calycin n=1 Tax=Penicillium nucicola TaxID=1850975 RepID=UPI002545215C|nr:Calycin [Penicillium nucicola]KAJ5748197.1 Calycin [Penicillium nucicola]